MPKNNLSKASQTILNKYEKTGEDFDCYLGQVFNKTTSASLTDILYHAQVFSNKDFRGALVSSTTFQHGYQRVARLSNVDGLFYDRFTSYVLIDKTEGLGDIRETYTSTKYNSFHSNLISTNFSNYESKLSEIANQTEQQTKRFGVKVKTKLKLSEKECNNSVCALVDKIYQVAYAKLENTYKTNLEKVTAAIFATYVTTKALDFRTNQMPDCESRLNEALRLNFVNHLNGCYANSKLFSISDIIKDGAKVGMDLIEKMGLDKKDVQEKNDRLGIKMKNAPQSLFDALFGAKHVEKSFVLMDDDASKKNTNTQSNLVSDATDVGKSKVNVQERVRRVISTVPLGPKEQTKEQTKEQIKEQTKEQIEEFDPMPERTAADAPPVIYLPGKIEEETKAADAPPVIYLPGKIQDQTKLDDENQDDRLKSNKTANTVSPTVSPRNDVKLITDGTRIEVVKSTQEVAETTQIAKPGETIAKVGETIVGPDAVIGKPGDVAHKKGNAINYSTLKKNLLTKIIDKLNEKANDAANRAEKKKDFDALTESNFWTGASAGIAGGAASKNRTAAYYEGHKLGKSVRNGVVYEISKFYSSDKKTLLRDVVGKGSQITTILGDEAVKECGMNTFSEFVEKIVSSFAKALERFKNKTTNTSNQQTHKDKKELN